MYNLTCLLKWIYALLTWSFKVSMCYYKDHINYPIGSNWKSYGLATSTFAFDWEVNALSKASSEHQSEGSRKSIQRLYYHQFEWVLRVYVKFSMINLSL